MLWAFIVVFIIMLDQYVKHFAIAVLKGTEGIAVISNVFHLYYVENKGAAFGILQNQRIFFIAVTFIILVAMLLYIYFTQKKSRLLYLSFAFICGGAIGNLIDRIRLSYVIDMFDLRLINFAVFNVADSFVVIGAILLSIYLLFFDKANKGDSIG